MRNGSVQDTTDHNSLLRLVVAHAATAADSWGQKPRSAYE